MKFRFWLSPKYVKQQVGKVTKISVSKNILDNKPVNLSDIINYEDHTFDNLDLDSGLI